MKRFCCNKEVIFNYIKCKAINAYLSYNKERAMKTNYIILLLIVIVFSCKKKDTTPQGDNEIWLLYKRFNPTFIEIKRGTTLTFINKDNSNHTVTHNGKLFASGKMKTGDKFEYTFADSADYTVYCNYHPDNLQEQVYVRVK